MTRCHWAVTEYSIPYHDEEWGVPLHDDRKLFEFLVLDGAQAGLSWETILRKRARYREVFDNLEIARVATYDERKITDLLADAGIVRNRAKIASAIDNACATLRLQEEFGSFDAYLWGFVDGKTIVNRPRSPKEIPATSAISDRLSKDLKRRGFSFVGSTICYAIMQSCGMVNDHLVSCFRHMDFNV